MTIEANKIYDNYFEMFASQGWKQLMELQEERLEQLKNQLVTATDLRQIGILQGHILATLTHLNFEKALREEQSSEVTK